MGKFFNIFILLILVSFIYPLILFEFTPPYQSTYEDNLCDICGKEAEYELGTEYNINSKFTRLEYVHEYCFYHEIIFSIVHPITVFSSSEEVDPFIVFTAIFGIISRFGFVIIILVALQYIEVRKRQSERSSLLKLLVLTFALGVLAMGYWLIVPGSDVFAIEKSDPYPFPGPAKGQREYTNSIGIEFVLVPAGEFQMGSPTFEKGRRDSEGPLHTVTIEKAYYLGKYEVTIEQWREVMNVSTHPLYYQENVLRNDLPNNLPIFYISWVDVQEFVKKLNEKEGTDRYRLPSEAEWEYAARAGTTTRYSFGNDDSDLGDYAWYSDNSDNKPHPVGQKQPNPWGLYDMHGNVFEWVQDEWHDDYNDAPTDGSAWESLNRNGRVFRAGNFRSSAEGCRSASRYSRDPTSYQNSFGFRLLREV